MSAGDEAPIDYSRGRDRFDNYPEQRSAASFEDFAQAVLADRSTAKGLAYISAPFARNDGRHHRCAAGALPRRYLALDQDGGTAHGFVELGMYLAQYLGFGYTTARHTKTTPRARYILALSRPVDRAEGIRLGAALQRLIEAHVGSRAVVWDKSAHQGEQPLYTPLVGAEVMRYDGDPIDVDAVLALAPKAEPRVHRADELDPYRAALLDRGLVLRELGPGKDAIVCPFAAEHSEVTSPTSTVYFWPRHGGYQWGGIHCLHEHCAERNKDQRRYLEKLGLDPREVWRGQATGAASCDALPPVEAYAADAAQHAASAKAPPGDEYRSGNGAAPGGASGVEEWSEPQPQAQPYPPIPPLAELQIDPAKLATAQITPRCVVESYLYADVAVFPGPGGTGKTTLFLFEVVHIVLGWALYGLTVCTPGSVVIVTAEDRRELLEARLHRLMEAMELTAEERAKICAGVMIWDVTGSVCRLTELDARGNVVLTGLADAIVKRFREAAPVMVGLDPVISFGAGERIVNDNEHSLILAARRIVNGLGCCVRLVCHTGQDAARSMVLDQYASRGGSALSDGSRMVSVLQAWEDADAEKLAPPIGFTLADDEDGMVLARPKLSFVPKHQRPHIWIKRRGWAFEHFLGTRPDPEAEARARVEQVHRFLSEGLKHGRRYTQNMLQDVALLKRKDLRIALATLLAAGRVIYAPLPERPSHGARDYLHPVAAP